MNKQVYILGTGGMAKEAYAICQDCGIIVTAFLVTHNEESKADFQGVPVAFDSILDTLSPQDVELICAVGLPERLAWIETWERNGFHFRSLIHPSAVVASSASLGAGVIISANTTIFADASLQDYVIINANSSVGHDVVMGRAVTIGPGVTIGGNVRIGEQTWVSIGSTIIHQIEIGGEVFVGAGAVVVNDIPAHVLAYGVPARQIRQITLSDMRGLMA